MPHPLLLPAKPATACPIHIVDAASYPGVAAALSAPAQGFLAATGFKPTAGKIALVPGGDGRIEAVLIAAENNGASDPFFAGRLPGALPAGDYAFARSPDKPELAVLGYLMAAYRFARYKKTEAPVARLAVPAGVDAARVAAIARAVSFGRDLINTPASDMGPAALAGEAKAFAANCGFTCSEIVGEDLIAANFPMIHAVGRAAKDAPRLIDLRWGDAGAPKVTLVGKGVCFDTGGLDIKPSSAMLLMKKDMGGAATALAAARMISEAGLRVNLRVLLPIVENSISANAFRASDILTSRKGITVEVGNTDAEGRLILADAMAYGDEEAPDLMLDFATLTGAARVALGPDLPPFYTEDEALAAAIAASGTRVCDPVWRLPLWDAYTSMLDSKIADVSSTGSGGFAGSITAALFLRKFVTKARSHAHFDIYGWSPSVKSGLPEGGNPQVARLVLDLLENRYGR